MVVISIIFPNTKLPIDRMLYYVFDTNCYVFLYVLTLTRHHSFTQSRYSARGRYERSTGVLILLRRFIPPLVCARLHLCPSVTFVFRYSKLFVIFTFFCSYLNKSFTSIITHISIFTSLSRDCLFIVFRVD